MEEAPAEYLYNNSPGSAFIKAWKEEQDKSMRQGLEKAMLDMEAHGLDKFPEEMIDMI
jgi:hypothetical protein